MILRKKIAITAMLLLMVNAMFATEIYVSPTGNDSNDGSAQSPLATLATAVRQAREMRRQKIAGTENGVQILMLEGVYPLYEPIRIRPEDSGTETKPLLIKNAKGANVTISGGVALKNWKKSGKFLVADVPHFNGRPHHFRQLWVNGQKADKARDVVDFEQMQRIIRNDKVNQVLWIPSVAARKIQKAPYAEMVLHQMWEVSFLRIKSVEIHGDSAAVRFHNPESKLQFERPWPQPMVGNGVNSPFYLTNAIELLDAPGEWYHDIDTRKLYYLPRKGETAQNINAIIPALETLVEVEGTTDRPVEHVFFEGITFSHTTWMRPSTHGHVPLQAGMYLTEAYRLRPQISRPDNNHKLDNQGWLGRGAAAVTVAGANNVRFYKCNFTQLGFSGLDYITGTKGGKVEACKFTDIAGNGLVVGSFSPPSHETHVPYHPTDQREICTGLLVRNNYFNNVTNEEWGCVAIAAGYVSFIDIVNNDISDVSYSGISLGWGWNQTVVSMRNNRIHRNHIHRYGKHMYDVAGIYTLGSMPKSVISENYVHSIYKPSYVHDPSHWFYLYTDEGSSYIIVRNNYTEAEKFLQNANGPGNTWINNGPMVNDSVKVNAGIMPPNWLTPTAGSPSGGL